MYKCDSHPTAASSADDEQQPAVPAQLPSAAHAAAGAGGGGQCGKFHVKEECRQHAPDLGCLWCQNKHSPFPGSDGMCVDEPQPFLPRE
jgi:hypothetical protein